MIKSWKDSGINQLIKEKKSVPSGKFTQRLPKYSKRVFSPEHVKFGEWQQLHWISWNHARNGKHFTHSKDQPNKYNELGKVRAHFDRNWLIMQENISVSRPTKYYKYPKNMNITLTEFFLMFRQENKSPLLENFNKKRIPIVRNLCRGEIVNISTKSPWLLIAIDNNILPAMWWINYQIIIYQPCQLLEMFRINHCDVIYSSKANYERISVFN